MNPPNSPNTSPDPSPIGDSETQTGQEAEENPETDSQILSQRTGMIADIAQDLVSSNPQAELPDNKFTDIYTELKKEMETSGAKSGPLAMAAHIFYFLAKYYGMLGSLMPDGLSNSLDEESLKDEKLSDEEQKKLLEMAKSKSMSEWDDTTDEAVDNTEYKGKTLESASTKYVTSLLGIEELDKPLVLAAKLAHTQKNGKNYYERHPQTSIQKLISSNKGFPKGAVIVFKQGFNNTFSGYATGNGTEIAFFNAKARKVEKFQLSDSPQCSLGRVVPHLVFIPRFLTDEKWASENSDRMDPEFLGNETKLKVSVLDAKNTYIIQREDIQKGSGALESTSNAIDYIVNNAIMSRKVLGFFKIFKDEISKLPPSEEKTRQAKFLGDQADEYHQFLDEEIAKVEAYIAREEADEEATHLITAPDVFTPEEESTHSTPATAEEKPDFQKAVEEYEKLLDYLVKVRKEVEPYL